MFRFDIKYKILKRVRKGEHDQRTMLQDQHILFPATTPVVHV
jgi:hypothetical protein